MIIVIGRGHGGTRAIAKTLVDSGVYMGHLNESYDHYPAEPAYAACKIVSQRVPWPWDFTKLGDPTIEFQQLISQYLLGHILRKDTGPSGWKLPENTLMYPWLVKMFPEAHFIHWIRNPLDSISGYHLTDDLTPFGVTSPPFRDLGDLRYFSWLYQEAIVAATPRPAKYHPVWFEDFVLHQEETLAGLETFLGMPLKRINVDRKSVAKYAVNQDVVQNKDVVQDLETR